MSVEAHIAPARTVRVAIYCRKSVTEGLDQDFNSLDAQRQAVEAYVESQRGEGWVALPKSYQDGGFSGSSTDRPAFQALLRDVESGLVDVVAVYKIDRLSRSSRDFVRILDLFDQHGVAFVSVTQQFSTTNSMGKLVLNILMSFSEFERDVISERIRDKIQATRRRGMWTGGRPILGYDVVDTKLVVNLDEAHQVRETFTLYLERGSLRETVEELRCRGWRNKSFVNRHGSTISGKPIGKTTLYGLLTNNLYRGLMRVGDDVAEGIHEAIVDQELWDAVQSRLEQNGNAGGSKTRNKTGALLRGLLYCGLCGSVMTHTFSTKSGKRYRYYVCSKEHARGKAGCTGARVPAGTFEGFVAKQIRMIGEDAALVTSTVAAIHEQHVQRKPALESERRRLVQERRRLSDRRDGLVGLLAESNADQSLVKDVAKIDEELQVLDGRLAELTAEFVQTNHGVDEDDLRQALASFTPVWDQLFPRERERILRLLIERITYHPDSGETDIDLRKCGIQALAEEAQRQSA